MWPGPSRPYDTYCRSLFSNAADAASSLRGRRMACIFWRLLMVHQVDAS